MRREHAFEPERICRTDSDRIAAVWNALAGVPDPEIPPVSVVDLGMIAGVRIVDETIVIDLTPTFAACPALELIRNDITKAATACGETSVRVDVVFNPPWTTDRITDEGRRKLKEFGLAPPGVRCTGGEPKIDDVACPFCNSSDTVLESIFGPTLCRSIHYCHQCLQSFEHFKAV